MVRTPSGVSFSSGGGVSMIEFDTYRFAPGEELVDYAKKEIAELASQGVEIKLRAEELGDGILTLIVEQAKNVGDKIINLIKQIIDRIKASTAPIASTI